MKIFSWNRFMKKPSRSVQGWFDSCGRHCEHDLRRASQPCWPYYPIRAGAANSYRNARIRTT